MVTGSVTGTDPDGDPVTLSVSTNPAYGSLAFDPSDGTFTYTPDPTALANVPEGDSFPETFDITIDDNRGGLTYAHVALAVTPLAPNQNPSLNPESGSPSNGVVVGNVNGADPENDPLSYNVTVQPTKGTLDFRQDGSFTYTPYASSRTAAAATDGPDTDHFTVTAADGYGGTVSKVVTVEIAPTGVLGVTTVAGSLVAVTTGTGTGGGAVVSPDGGRAILVTAANSDGTQRQAVVIDTNTGVQLGSAIALPDSSSQAAVLYNASGSRAAVVVQTEGDTGVTSHVTLIDTASGQQISTIDLDGAPGNVGTQFNSAGDRLVMTAIVPTDPDNPGTSVQTHVVTLDSLTGNEVGNTTSRRRCHRGHVQPESAARLFDRRDVREQRQPVRGRNHPTGQDQHQHRRASGRHYRRGRVGRWRCGAQSRRHQDSSDHQHRNGFRDDDPRIHDQRRNRCGDRRTGRGRRARSGFGRPDGRRH